MFDEEDLLPISLLQHLLFCERRAVLVYLEGLWDDNLATIEGRLLHERTHQVKSESRGNLRVVRGLPLRSLRLGLVGKADVVEFHRVDNEPSGAAEEEGQAPLGVSLPTAVGRWQPYPVEYKRGRQRAEEGYEVQLCAQAYCLEEMLATTVPRGAIYYGKSAHRLEIIFDSALRARTEAAACRLREVLGSERVFPASYHSKCRECSLLSQCMPKAVGGGRNLAPYLDTAFGEPGRDGR